METTNIPHTTSDHQTSDGVIFENHDTVQNGGHACEASDFPETGILTLKEFYEFGAEYCLSLNQRHPDDPESENRYADSFETLRKFYPDYEIWAMHQNHPHKATHVVYDEVAI